MQQLKRADRKILASLQKEGRLTSNELAERVALSPSQCSRRRAQLEAEGYIRGYHAELDREKLGYDIIVMVSVTAATHTRADAKRLTELFSEQPQVLEAYELTGSMDYLLKVVAPNLAGLSTFVNEVLLPHEAVQHVNTAIVLDTLKEFQGLPLP
jgi:DNA-binding Lrp family transcriptional regulator